MKYPCSKFKIGQLVRIKSMDAEHYTKYGGLSHIGETGKIKVITTNTLHYPYEIVFKDNKGNWCTNSSIAYLECELESIIKPGEQLLLWEE